MIWKNDFDQNWRNLTPIFYHGLSSLSVHHSHIGHSIYKIMVHSHTLRQFILICVFGLWGLEKTSAERFLFNQHLLSLCTWPRPASLAFTRPSWTTTRLRWRRPRSAATPTSSFRRSQRCVWGRYIIQHINKLENVSFPTQSDLLCCEHKKFLKQDDLIILIWSSQKRMCAVCLFVCLCVIDH